MFKKLDKGSAAQKEQNKRQDTFGQSEEVTVPWTTDVTKEDMDEVQRVEETDRNNMDSLA